MHVLAHYPNQKQLKEGFKPKYYNGSGWTEELHLAQPQDPAQVQDFLRASGNMPGTYLLIEIK
jgi:hypothetical protein